MVSWLIIAGLVMPAEAGKRTKKKAEAAVQEAAEAEDSSCQSDVGCVGNKGPVPEIKCRRNSRHAGSLMDPRSGRELDLSGATARLRLEHKLDVDAHEDRCITDVWIDAHHGDSGCALTLHYKANPKYDGKYGSKRYVLVSGQFIADSFCPGWDDAVEAKYFWTPRSEAPMLILSKDSIDERTARESCVSISAQLDGSLQARRLIGRGSTLDLSEFSVGGSFASVGDTGGVCAGVPELPKEVVTGAQNTAFSFYRSYSFSETDDTGAFKASSLGVLYSRSLTPTLAVYGALGFLDSDDFAEEDSFTHIAAGGQVFVWGDYFTMGAFLDLELGRTSSSFEDSVWDGDLKFETTINTLSTKVGFRYVSEVGVVAEVKAGVPFWMVSSSITDAETGEEYDSADDTLRGIETMLLVGYTF